MKLFGWVRNKYRFMGIRVLRRRYFGGGVMYYLLCVLPIIFIPNRIQQIQKRIDNWDNLDTRKLDEQIRRATRKIRVTPITDTTDALVILASQMYDMGGHTECIKNIVSAAGKYKTYLFLTRTAKSYRDAKHKMAEIEKYTTISGIQYNGGLWRHKLRDAFDEIISQRPSAVLSFIHMDDAFGAALLCLLQRAGVRILFYNHGSHFPTLGMSFANLILEGTPTTARITNQQRGFENTVVVGLPYLCTDACPVFSDDEIQQLRAKFGITPETPLTMSGASSYKFFDKTHNASPYFEMIKQLLMRNPDLRHIMIVPKLMPYEREIFDKIFADSNVADRIQFIAPNPNYKVLFKCADVFIDSFPISSALTQIDLISLRVPNVIKINRENPIWTFHEYMPENYPFAFDNADDMIVGIEKLIRDKNLRKSVADSNYAFFTDNYAGERWFNKLLGLING